MQHRQALWLVFPANVLTSSFNRHPMRGGTRITRGVQHAHRECVGAGREKSIRCRRCSRGAFRSTRDGGGSSNHRAIVCATLQGAPIIALSWTGCYLGGHIGGSFVDKKFGGPFVDNAVPSTFGAPTSFAISDPSADLNSTGLLGGGQVGCNFQFAANWVIGFEGDASGANQQGGGDSRLITEGAVLNGTLPGITT